MPVQQLLTLHCAGPRGPASQLGPMSGSLPRETGASEPAVLLLLHHPVRVFMAMVSLRMGAS